MIELKLGGFYKGFYYKYYPATQEECFCFVDDFPDYSRVDKELYLDNGKRYPLGYLLSKCFQFYEKIRVEPLSCMREFINNKSDENIDYGSESFKRYLDEVRANIYEYENNISYDEVFNRETKGEVQIVTNGNRREMIFKTVFPKIDFLETGNLDYFPYEEYDDIELFAFFVLNDMYEIDEDYEEHQIESVISRNIIFNFIEESIEHNEEYCTYENLYVTAMNNRDNLDNGYTSFGDLWSTTLEYMALRNQFQCDKLQIKEVEVYRYYKIENLKDFLYATLQEILSNKYVIKRCKFCGSIFVTHSKSQTYCQYKLSDGETKTCYQLHNSGTIMYKEKYDKCETMKKKIRDKFNKWINYHKNNIDGDDFRNKIKYEIYDFIHKLQRILTNEDEFYDCLVKIHECKYSNEKEYSGLKTYLNNIISKYENQ